MLLYTLPSMYQRRNMKVYDPHAKFRWNKWSCAAITVPLVLVFYLTGTSYPAHGIHQHNRINMVMNDLCTKIKHEADLAAIVWSHRAALSHLPNSFDGSVDNMKTLLTSGISNFDVDISILGGKDAESVSFYVAHPSRMSSVQNDPRQAAFQSVRPFLTQIAEYHHVTNLQSQKRSNQPLPHTQFHHTNLTPATRQLRLRPMVTIEPKFTDPVYIQQLVRIGNRFIPYNDVHPLTSHHSLPKFLPLTLFFLRLTVFVCFFD